MDKTFLIRLEDSLKDIRQTLLLNETIRTLLYYESDTLEEGMEVAVPAVEMIKDNIFLQPIIEVDNNPPFDKKMFISITSPSLTFSSDNSIVHGIRVTIMIDKTNWVYQDNKIRVNHLAQEVINELDGKKSSAAGQLQFQQIVESITDKTIYGKSLYFTLEDGVGDE